MDGHVRLYFICSLRRVVRMEEMEIRRIEEGDEKQVSNLIRKTINISEPDEEHLIRMEKNK